MMKVAYLIGSLNRGGAETLLLDIFHQEDRAPFDMMLIHRKGGMYEQELETLTHDCYRISPRRWHLLSYLRQLRDKIQNEQVNVIHAFYRLDAVYAWLATMGLRIPIVVTFHGYMGSECGWGMSVLYRMAMRMADKLCFVSEVQKTRYEERYGAIVRKKGVVLYNGLDFAKLDAAKSIVESKELKIKSGIRLCMVGNFNSVRSQMVVVKALRLLKSRAENQESTNKFEFYFIGGRYRGEEYYYDECVEYCREHGLDNVHFLGTRDDVPALLKSMDGFVYSSNNDTFGIAAIEAIASGLPIVVNDHPVMKEVCGEGNEGIQYFKTDDAEDAAAQIEALLANIEQSKQFAIPNAEAVRNKYSIQTHIHNVYAVYQSL